MRVKLALAAALFLALAGLAGLAGRLQDAERRADDASAVAGEASARRDRIEAWVRDASDSLAAAGVPPAPPAALAALPDSVRRAFVLEGLEAALRHWRLESARARALDLLPDDEVAAYRRRGLADPAAMLRADLLRHRELIPFEPAPGGTVGFVPDPIVLLPGGWAHACFRGDGISGSCLLSFEVLKGGAIAWRRLAARRDDEGAP